MESLGQPHCDRWDMHIVYWGLWDSYIGSLGIGIDLLCSLVALGRYTGIFGTDIMGSLGEASWDLSHWDTLGQA